MVVVGWGTEFSDSWVREGRGARTEGVQLPDSLVDEAVFQSVRSWLGDSSVLLPDGSRLKKLCVGGWDHLQCWRALRVRRGVVNVLEGGERDTNDLLLYITRKCVWMKSS